MMNMTSAETMLNLIKLMVVSYAINKTHVINNLIILEYIVVIVTLIMFKTLECLAMELYLIFFLLILMITESIVGLSILIAMIRTHSNDYLKTSTITLF